MQDHSIMEISMAVAIIQVELAFIQAVEVFIQVEEVFIQEEQEYMVDKVVVNKTGCYHKDITPPYKHTPLKML